MQNRGRKPTSASPFELQAAINLLESLKTFTTRSQLWKEIEESEWAKNQIPRPLSAQTAMAMAKKNNLTIVTPIGHRGKVKGCSAVPNTGTRNRGIPENAAIALKKAFPLGMVTGYGENDRPLKILAKVVNKTIGGSMRNAVKLKCLDCTNIQPIEIKNCSCMECPLWAFRPYKN